MKKIIKWVLYIAVAIILFELGSHNVIPDEWWQAYENSKTAIAMWALGVGVAFFVFGCIRNKIKFGTWLYPTDRKSAKKK